MSIQQKIKHEFRDIVLVTLFFAAWLGVFMGLKVLLLEDYQIRVANVSVVLIGALILAKVVLILEHVPLGAWLREKPVWVDVVLRTILYATGTFVVMLLEKSLESRHAQGGFGPALTNILQHRDMPHIWVSTICLGGALFFFNLLAAVRRHLGGSGLSGVFLAPLRQSENS